MQQATDQLQQHCSPEEAGYSRTALDRLDHHLKDLVSSGKLQSASYMLSREGKVFASNSLGNLRYTENSPAFRTESIRRIASITKWFTLASIIMLMEEGKLNLHQQVKVYIPEFDKPLYEKIDIYHLLTHTSGIVADGGYFLEAYPTGWGDIQFMYGDHDFNGPAPDRTPEEAVAFRKSQWIKAILAANPICEPGKSWRYSSAGFIILGEIISRVSGMPYEQFVMERLVKPLGLNATFFDVPASLQNEVCVVNEWEARRLGQAEDRTGLPPRSGGGLYSTLADLTVFGNMMLNGTSRGQRFISRKSMETIVRDQFPQGIPAYHWGAELKNYHYGLSCILGLLPDLHWPSGFSHEGAGRSVLAVDPAEKFVAAVFVPTAEEWIPESILNVKNIIWSGLR
ncbi:serine hydrolase domain-containing protein [Paenibacillus gansuensis]|uniref:Serine hydrolase domain-containing protein n=1 Tax=Paenibacillus gansuensis TaxID=306542 RepID=A0ABW5P9P6_9BACL